ncbi:MAG: CopD family protein [Acidobacteria bacterium]|nr:CopD family protein [Acidobacteriota bacterium]
MYQLSVGIHILAACIWVGGLIYTATIVVPYAISRPANERQQLLRGQARRFRRIGWSALGIAFVTGIANLALRISPIRVSQLLNGEAYDPRAVDAFIAEWLPWKLFLVLNMTLLMLFHDLTSIRAAKSFQGPANSAPGNRLGTLAASLATLLALAVLYVSVRLVRG